VNGARQVQYSQHQGPVHVWHAGQDIIKILVQQQLAVHVVLVLTLLYQVVFRVYHATQANIQL
jgi:hypothetical protein